MAEKTSRFKNAEGKSIGDHCPGCGANNFVPTLTGEKCGSCGYVDSNTVKETKKA